MTEQEYCDLSDLVIFRSVLTQLRMVNSFESPNKERLENIQETLQLMIDHLYPAVTVSLDE